MLADQRCRKCFERNYDSLLVKFPLTSSQYSEFSVVFNRLMDEGEVLTSPEIQRHLQHHLRKLNGVDDPFREEKQKSNQVSLKLYEEWKPRVLASDDPFSLALRLAIAGNIMDYGANSNFDIHQTIEKVLKTDFAINHASRLKQRIRKARSILYLGDNSGEIVFDKLLIETIMHPFVTYVVKGGPVINDVTDDDAGFVGMDLVADVISNGFDAPSTILEKSDPGFRALFESADLIISKGQGNFEGLEGYADDRIFFLLMIKCDVIAERIGVEKGGFVVYNQL